MSRTGCRSSSCSPCTGPRSWGLGIKDYFAKPEQVVEGQLRLRQKYRHDCLVAFYYAAAEIEAWGGEVRFFDDGPPNAGAPFITDPGMIASLRPPEVARVPVLCRVLETIAGLKARVGGEVPIFGVVMSPFALPVMQMGFEAYLNLLLHDRPRFQALMEVNVAFSTAWAQAQLAAGATAICYFDPLLSPTILPYDLLLVRQDGGRQQRIEVT
ncbi:MAG: uroporphyrinogen decarboxylase family protein, partial [bacterium]